MSESRQRETRYAPSLVVGVDPDSTRTALAWAVRQDAAAGATAGTGGAAVYRLAGIAGGGSSPVGVPWSSVSGQLAWLRERVAEGLAPALSDVLVAVETQDASSPWSADVEALRRVRYHWDAACEIAGARCEHVDPAAWERFVLTRAGVRAVGEGAIKAAYRQHAIAVLEREVNEDQAAAFGILQWTIEARLGASLIVGKSYAVA